jgi:hypothetical protein
MTVEIRQAGNEWLVEVRGEPIGSAESSAEARALADYWEARLECIARWHGDADQVRELLKSPTPSGV